MNLRASLRSSRRSALLIGAAAVIGTGVGGTVALVQVPRYESTAQAFISIRDVSRSEPVDLVRVNDFSMQAANSVAAVATTPVVLGPVIQRLGLPETTDRLARR